MTTQVITAIARKGDEVRAITLHDNLTVLLSISGANNMSAGRRWPDAEAAKNHVQIVAEDWDMWDFTLQGEPMVRTLTEPDLAVLFLLSGRRSFTANDFERALLLGIA